MLGWRIAISAVLIPALLGMFWLDAHQGDAALLLLLFCILLALRGCYEMCRLLTIRTMRPAMGVALVGSVLVVLAGWQHTRMNLEPGTTRLFVSLGWTAIALFVSFAALFLREALRFRNAGQSMESLGAGLVAVMYSGGLLAVTSQLRWFPSPEWGYFVIGSLIIAVKSGDIGAYTFGRLWGRRRMAPALSPGKTWMGALGAVVGSSLGGSAWLYFGRSLLDVPPPVNPIPAVVYCICLGAIGLVGDLCESLIKRDVEQKDSAALMPGFGGVLDLLDSVLFTAPFALAFWVLWPPAM